MKAVLIEELERLRRADGILDPADVVEAATNPESPLHHRFEWNDDKAARLFRVEQARQLIREMKISFRVGPQVVQAPAYVPSVSKAPNAYVRTDEIEKGSAEARQVILDEMTRLAGNIDRVRRLAAYLKVEDELSEFLASLAEVSEAAKAMARAD